MSILSDLEIKELCIKPTYWSWKHSGSFKQMITPFEPNQVKTEEYKHYSDDDGERSTRKIISYGLSSYGYDIRLNNEDIKVFNNLHSVVVDPRNVDKRVYTKLEIHTDEVDGCEYVLLPPNTGLLGHTVETFHMPNNVIAQAVGKSTYARCFISVIVTPLEPGWRGQLVIEVVNHSPLPARIYLNQGICQLLFFRGNQCDVSYEDRGGKYMFQVGTQNSIV